MIDFKVPLTPENASEPPEICLSYLNSSGKKKYEHAGFFSRFSVNIQISENCCHFGSPPNFKENGSELDLIQCKSSDDISLYIQTIAMSRGQSNYN